MLIKINDKIINTANIVTADFISATEKLKGAFTIICANNVDPANVLGRIKLTTFLWTASLLGAMALAACLFPARRAANVETTTALRCE
jgi:ABC-type lipoprotein release transport system permease subunit